MKYIFAFLFITAFNLNSMEKKSVNWISVVIQGNTERLTELLEANPRPDWAPQALFIAIQQNNDSTPAMVASLLNHIPNVETTNKWGETPLHYAVKTGNEAVVKLLLDGGALIDAKSEVGRTPEDYARDRAAKDLKTNPTTVFTAILALLVSAKAGTSTI